MSKPRKKTRRKRIPKNKSTRSIDLSNEVDDLFYEALLKRTSSKIENLSTPFGAIPYSDGMVAFQLKHKKLLFEIISMQEETEGPLKRLIFYEKCKDKYPNEPFLENGIAACYEELGRKEEYERKVLENFELYKGYPNIDISYIRFKSIEDKTRQTFYEIFGNELNIANAYPEFKAFDESIICDFYLEAAFYYEQMKQYEIAKECLEIVKIFNPNQAEQLSLVLDFKSDPKKRRAVWIQGTLFLLFVLAVVVGIIWGIVKLFQWIF